jgi:hypothetical protein
MEKRPVKLVAELVIMYPKMLDSNNLKPCYTKSVMTLVTAGWDQMVPVVEIKEMEKLQSRYDLTSII